MLCKRYLHPTSNLRCLIRNKFISNPQQCIYLQYVLKDIHCLYSMNNCGLTISYLFLDYMRGQPAGGYPPLRSGYDELDTTLMPPRGGLPLPDQYRNSPSPGLGGHPGYSGGSLLCLEK